MFEIPSDLNPALVGLAWLRGRWEGTGYREWPGEGKLRFSQQVDFVENGGEFLHYLAQSFEVDDAGTPLRPLATETGFWMPNADGTVDVVISSPEGWTENLVGKLSPGRVDLTSDKVIKIDGRSQYEGGKRLYGHVEGKLMYSFDRATHDVELRSYVWVILERAEG